MTTNRELFLEYSPKTPYFYKPNAGLSSFVSFSTDSVTILALYKRNSSETKVLNQLKFSFLLFKDVGYRFIALTNKYTVPSKIDYSSGVFYSESEFIVGITAFDIGASNPNNLALSAFINPWS